MVFWLKACKLPHMIMHGDIIVLHIKREGLILLSRFTDDNKNDTIYWILASLATKICSTSSSPILYALCILGKSRTTQYIVSGLTTCSAIDKNLYSNFDLNSLYLNYSKVWKFSVCVDTNAPSR